MGPAPCLPPDSPAHIENCVAGSGLVLDWQQSTGTLLASGDVRVIRVWDADKELCERDMPTFSDASVSCLTSEHALGNLVIAGCGDGAVRLYDRRVSPREWCARASGRLCACAHAERAAW